MWVHSRVQSAGYLTFSHLCFGTPALEPSRMASERLAALHRHLAEETARLLGWEAGQEVAARDREAR